MGEANIFHGELVGDLWWEVFTVLGRSTSMCYINEVSTMRYGTFRGQDHGQGV